MQLLEREYLTNKNAMNTGRYPIHSLSFHSQLTGQSKEADIDEGELPKAPLCFLRRRRKEFGLGVGFYIQLGPPSKILLDDRREHDEGQKHDKSLDTIGESDRTESTSPLKHQNQKHDDYHRVGCQVRNGGVENNSRRIKSGEQVK